MPKIEVNEKLFFSITTRNFWRVVNQNKILIVATGGMYSEVQKAVRAVLLDGGYADIYLLRFIKPFDVTYFVELEQVLQMLVRALFHHLPQLSKKTSNEVFCL